MTPLIRKYRKAAFLAVLALLGLAVVLPASAHTPDGCERVRGEVADRLLVLDAATEQGGLTSAQQSHITRERAILAKALAHCAGTPSASPSASTPTGAPTSPPASSPAASPSGSPSATPSPSGPLPAAWPDADNTGPPAGTVLTAYTGPCTITAAVVIDAKAVDCDLDIRAAGVEIRNSVVNGSVSTPDDMATTASVVVVDSLITYPTVTSAGRTMVGAVNVTLLRVEVDGGNRGVYCRKRCDVRDSWIHGIKVVGSLHASAVRVSQDATLVHNTIVCDAPDNSSGGGCSADLTGYPDFEPVRNNHIEGNLIKATSGGFCAYGGATAGKPYSNDPTNATNIVFRDNVFERGTSPGQHGFTCGYYGAVTDFAPGRTGNVWENNRYDDGAVLNP